MAAVLNLENPAISLDTQWNLTQQRTRPIAKLQKLPTLPFSDSNR